ncbi:MAG: CYTH domain-containing protein [Candidatus Peribacteria bacterium]|nr:MAG: CYTH domain-containing protein [Candidatus Peribacteria bacterium]
MHDRYCDTPDGQLAAKGMSVRVRQEGDVTVITTKSKIVGKKGQKKGKYPTKVRKEEDTTVPSLKAAWAAIAVMGLEVVREKHKIRISYRLDANSVCDVDFYDGLPPIVEIESTKRKVIYQRINRLGLADYRVTTWGSRKLFRYYA